MTGVTGSEKGLENWLQTQGRRGHLTFAEVEGARLWASDVAELSKGIPLRQPGQAAGGVGDDVMRIAVRRRVAQVERRLGGTASPTYRVAWWVAVEGHTAGEAAGLLGERVRTTTAMDLLRLALQEVALVYGLVRVGKALPTGERRLTGRNVYVRERARST